MLLNEQLLAIVVASTLEHRRPRAGGGGHQGLFGLLCLVLLLEEDLRDDDIAGAERLAGRFPRFDRLGRWRWGRSVLETGRQLRSPGAAGSVGRGAGFGRASL